MRYINARKLLPTDVLELIQDYIDGEYLYIPKKTANKKSWGENTSTKEILAERNHAIYKRYLKGEKTAALAEAFFLSPKSIQRIVLTKKKEQL